MGDAAYWPSWMRELALKNHYKYHDRFTFMLHFLGNVVPPYIVVEHMSTCCLGSGTCRQWTTSSTS